MIETSTTVSTNIKSPVCSLLAVGRLNANLSVVVLLCSLFVGCGPQAGNPRPLDRTLAMDSMKLFLETWRDQGSPDSLKDRSPSVVVNDADWDSGNKLLAFEIPTSGDDDGSNLYLDVKLTLKDETGEQRDKTIRYVIGTKPLVSIFRDN